MANWTPEEAAKLLTGRINQPHYIQWVLEKVIAQSRKDDEPTLDIRELRAGLLAIADYIGPNCRNRVADAVRGARHG